MYQNNPSLCFGESNKNITFRKSKSENCRSSLNKNEVDHPADVWLWDVHVRKAQPTWQ
jgi:hypothetical protein